MRERVICPICGREVSGYVPRGGDGSGLRLPKHKDPRGRDCDGRYEVVRGKP